MARLAQILYVKYPGARWSLQGDDYDQLEWHSDDIPKPSLKELQSHSDEVDREIQWIEIRAERNRRLRDTDWTQLADQPKKVKDKWKKYRAELRDLPNFFDDPDFVIWPEVPED